MALYHYTIQDEAHTGAIWGLSLDIADNGRSITIDRDTQGTNFAQPPRFSSIAIRIVDRATGGTNVNTGTIWNDLTSPITAAWPNYALEIDLYFYYRESGNWVRTTAVPGGQPQGVATAGGGGTPPVQAARFEISNVGTLRLLNAAQTDLVVESRAASATPENLQTRYTNIEYVKSLLKAPTNQEATSWQNKDFDARLLQIVRAAEVEADEYCGRTFDVAEASSARTYRRRGRDHVDTDDFIGTPVVTIASSVQKTDTYVADIVNVSHRNVFRGITFTSAAQNQIPPYLMGGSDLVDDIWADRELNLPAVTVEAQWGWDRVPDAISYAVALRSVRLFRRPDEAALGVIPTEIGGIIMPGYDSDIEMLLAPYRLIDGL